MQDDGIGIDRIAAQHVFDPFYTTRLDEGGTGLGLSVAHGIVRDHGGTIRLEPAPTRGTLATVELPLADEATLHDQEPAPSVSSAART